jgi:hypothetical protein
MTESPNQRTLKESMRTVRTPEDFSYALRNFLDRFRRNPDVSLLEEAPDMLADQFGDEGLADAYLAASAALLCQEMQFDCPAWAEKSDRIYSRPWFAAKSPNLKAILLQESPAAFRVRNLFVSANALSRA